MGVYKATVQPLIGAKTFKLTQKKLMRPRASRRRQPDGGKWWEGC